MVMVAPGDKIPRSGFDCQLPGAVLVWQGIHGGTQSRSQLPDGCVLSDSQPQGDALWGTISTRIVVTVQLPRRQHKLGRLRQAVVVVLIEVDLVVAAGIVTVVAANSLRLAAGGKGFLCQWRRAFKSSHHMNEICGRIEMRWLNIGHSGSAAVRNPAGK